MGRCPFPDHPEKTPSFSVSEIKQVYHCFGCHKSGNLFSFLRDYLGYDFPEAVRYLSEKAGLEIPQSAEVQPEAQKKQILFEKANQLALKFFEENLKKSGRESTASQYLNKRGLTQEVIEKFQIGLATAEWEGLVQYLKSHSIPASIAEEMRLIVARKNDASKHFDLFRNRLMFPILSLAGKALAFGGRVLDPNDQPKYLNSPENPLFEKRKVLYGLNQTARYIRSEDRAVVVEGYMDLVSLYQAGIKDVCAVMSSSLTVEQAASIRRMTKNIVLLLDGDEAGIDGMIRSLQICLQADLHPKIVILPDGQDPDDYVKQHGTESMQNRIQSAQDLYLWFLKDGVKKSGLDPSKKIQWIDKVRPYLTAIPDPRLRDLYFDETAKELEVSTAWLWKAFKNQQGQGFPAAPNRNLKPAFAAVEGLAKAQIPSEKSNSIDLINLKSVSAVERTVLALCLKDERCFTKFYQLSGLDCLTNQEVKALFDRAADLYRQKPTEFGNFLNLFVTYLEEPAHLLQTLSGLDQQSGDDDGDNGKTLTLFNDAFKRLRENFLRKKLQEIQKDLSSGQGEDKSAQFEKLKDLQNQINEINRAQKAEVKN